MILFSFRIKNEKNLVYTIGYIREKRRNAKKGGYSAVQFFIDFNRLLDTFECIEKFVKTGNIRKIRFSMFFIKFY